MKADVEKQLDRMKSIKDNVQQNEIISGVLKEKLSEAQVLLTKLPVELQNRYDYLQTNMNYRQEYENLREKFFEWTRQTSDKLNVTDDGINFDSVDADLDDHIVI